MKNLEVMRKVICVLCIWNLLLTAGVSLAYAKHQEDKLNERICIEENIPPLEPITEEF